MKYYVNYYSSAKKYWQIEGLFNTKKEALECKKKYPNAIIQTLP